MVIVEKALPVPSVVVAVPTTGIVVAVTPSVAHTAPLSRRACVAMTITSPGAPIVMASLPNTVTIVLIAVTFVGAPSRPAPVITHARVRSYVTP